MEDSGEAGKLERRMVVEYGIRLDGVWLPLALLRRLKSHGPWDAPFTEATTDQERVLLAHALADRHNQAGLHRGTGLTGFLDAIPFEPTVPFERVPPPGKHPDLAADARRCPLSQPGPGTSPACHRYSKGTYTSSWRARIKAGAGCR
jgi:hypothetical protein